MARAMTSNQVRWSSARAMLGRDLGLRELSAAIAQLPRPATAGTSHSDLQVVAVRAS